PEGHADRLAQRALGRADAVVPLRNGDGQGRRGHQVLRQASAGPVTKPFHNPFGALAGLKEKLPPGKTPAQVAEAERKRPARAVVRLERAGRSGKEVTVVS